MYDEIAKDINKIIITISDISPYQMGAVGAEYTAETIEVEDFVIIKQLIVLILSFSDRSMSPQSLFMSEGINYLSHFIRFEDLDGERQQCYEFKEEIIDTLKQLLKRNDFSVPYEDIIEIEIAIPEK